MKARDLIEQVVSGQAPGAVLQEGMARVNLGMMFNHVKNSSDSAESAIKLMTKTLAALPPEVVKSSGPAIHQFESALTKAHAELRNAYTNLSVIWNDANKVLP